MFGIRTRQLAAVVVASLASPVALMAQWNPAGNCNCYTPTPAPVVTMVSQCMQPVTTMVARQMAVTEYRPKQTVENRPVTKLRMVAKPVTAYRQVMETKTVEVPATTYQTVTEMRTQTINKGRWQTITQPVTKMAACQYDNRPGMMGAMNRMGYQMRTGLQPNFTTHRQFIPQVCQCTVPVQRQVAVATTRQVTYQEAKMVAYQSTQQVAEYYTDSEKVTVTTMEPYSVTKTVQVPMTRMAFVDPVTGMAIAPQATQTAQEPQPTPTRAAEGNDLPPTNGNFKETSIQKPSPSPVANRNRVIRHDSAPNTLDRATVKTVSRTTQAAVASTGMDGWKAHKPAANELPAPQTATGRISVASK